MQWIDFVARNLYIEHIAKYAGKTDNSFYHAKKKLTLFTMLYPYRSQGFLLRHLLSKNCYFVKPTIAGILRRTLEY